MLYCFSECWNEDIYGSFGLIFYGFWCLKFFLYMEDIVKFLEFLFEFLFGNNIKYLLLELRFFEL